jgi:hypothetical protein
MYESKADKRQINDPIRTVAAAKYAA